VYWVNMPEALKGIVALKGRTSGEVVAEMAAGARRAKSASIMPVAWIQGFSPNKPRTVIFTSGDDTEANQLACV